MNEDAKDKYIQAIGREGGQEPLRHQTVDLPPIKPFVVEHVQQIRKCNECGELVYAPLPDDIKRNIFGPGVLAT